MCNIHHAQGPLRGVPFCIIQMIPEDAGFGWRPRRMRFCIHVFIFAQVDAIQHAGIEAFPPLAFTVFERQVPVVGNSGFIACLVGTEGCLPPPPGVFMMERDAITHSVLVAGICPLA